ncbi:hypothetical protein PsorP6_012662 [Peronosclerospora sorghi]|uniref:Uncharacterized protein n=1 Tax=Peronosclerospora sorghi TaxID=230839 RepID=A0ACC0WH08_9STRA|nr:hypothetical protein PsorP6_012662 [Peronosclerospora sorghi]
MASPSSAVDYSIETLHKTLQNKQNIEPALSAAIDAFLAKAQHLQRRDSRLGISGFEREYMDVCWSIDREPGYKASLTLETKATKGKNRYRDVLPIEKTRVKLQNLESDYINANYIDNNYIACCAPVPAAIQDFWHMVWQCDVHVVLMLTDFVERKRLKADMYWDSRLNQAVNFNGVYVWKQDISGHAKESRVIQHFQLTSWPDHGVLQDFQVIAPMLETMNSYRSEVSRALQVDARVVVHCSAGIGRSGTFIAIDILLKKLHQALLDKSKSVEERKGAIQHAVDIPRVVHRLRSQRPGMVQTPVRICLQLFYNVHLLTRMRGAV